MVASDERKLVPSIKHLARIRARILSRPGGRSTPTLHDNMCYGDTDTRWIVKYTSFSCDTHLLNKSSEVLLDACTHEISAATSFLLTEVG